MLGNFQQLSSAQQWHLNQVIPEADKTHLAGTQWSPLHQSSGAQVTTLDSIWSQFKLTWCECSHVSSSIQHRSNVDLVLFGYLDQFFLIFACWDSGIVLIRVCSKTHRAAWNGSWRGFRDTTVHTIQIVALFHFQLSKFSVCRCFVCHRGDWYPFPEGVLCRSPYFDIPIITLVTIMICSDRSWYQDLLTQLE